MSPGATQKRVNSLFLKLYLLVIAGLLFSVGYSLHQNWALKLQGAKDTLARQAGISNFIVSSAIGHASMALENAQGLFLPAIRQGGTLDALQAHAILHRALGEFKELSESSSAQFQGLMLYLDAQGKIVARTDRHPDNGIDVADRPYFLRLRDNPALERTYSPLVKARTTGEWVFHVAVPLRDDKGRFQGVLVHQIRAADISRELSRYIDTTQPELVISQQAGTQQTFLHPPSLLAGSTTGVTPPPYAEHAQRASSPQDAFVWPLQAPLDSQLTLVGYEHSELSGLTTTLALPLRAVWLRFLRENLVLFSISGISLLLISVIFHHLYRTSRYLTEALHDASNDTLTQIPNRRAFQEEVPRLLRDAVRTREPLSVLFIDIDHFKLFNDDYGHDGGDVALQGVARTLGSCVRRPLDFLCRWGGEEFVVILPHTTQEAALQLAQKMLDAVRAMRLQDPQGEPMRTITISIGIASATLRSTSEGEALVNAADMAMQAAKRQGRDRIVVQGRQASGPGP